MVQIETYVFMDLETTGLPRLEFNKTRITEISFVAVKRDHLLDAKVPRVQHKLTLCLNPRRQVSDESSKMTGLCNFLLEYEPEFNHRVFSLLDTFLSVLTPPVCFIAFNGLNFDYPILKNHLDKLKVKFSANMLCADSLYAFYEIENKETLTQSNSPDISTDDVDKSLDNEKETFKHKLNDTPNLSMQSINETTPKSLKRNVTPNTPKKIKKAKRELFPWKDKPSNSYKLVDVYERVLKRPAVDAHRAESDCIFCLEICVVLAKEFVEFVDKNHKKFDDIEPIAIGVHST